MHVLDSYLFFLIWDCFHTCTDTDALASDYKDDGTNILLDANENAYGPALALDAAGGKEEEGKGMNGLCKKTGDGIDIRGLNRYPDPLV